MSDIYMPGRVTPNFLVSEFDSRCGARYPSNWIHERLLPLCEELEILRHELGGHRIAILSGYRSPAHNRAVGGAEKSQHLQGRAADIAVQSIEPPKVQAAVLMLVRAGKLAKIKGCGSYRSFTHVDIRPVPSLVTWTG